MQNQDTKQTYLNDHTFLTSLFMFIFSNTILKILTLGNTRYF